MKNIIFKIIRTIGTILAFFNCLMFYAMRPCWSGISGTLGYKGGTNTFLYNLPIFICILFFLILLSDLILKKLFKKNWLYITYLIVSTGLKLIVLDISRPRKPPNGPQ